MTVDFSSMSKDDLMVWIQEAARLLPQDDLQALVHWASIIEPERRRAEVLKDEATMSVVEELWQQQPELKPAFETDALASGTPQWKQPRGAHDAYPPLSVVSHAGSVWRNVCGKLNVWEPGTDGPVPTWERVDPGPTGVVELPDTVTVTEDGTKEHPYTWSAGLVLKRGQFVTYEGDLFQLAQDHTTQDHWRPGPGLESIYTPH